MLFQFLNFSQCVECIIFVNKTIFKNFSRATTNGSFGIQSCFPVFVISQR